MAFGEVFFRKLFQSIAVSHNSFLKPRRAQLALTQCLQHNTEIVLRAINNLRRIGARRAEARDETRRIEERLGKLFESRGFHVLTNWTPEPSSYPGVGEIDLICASDGNVLVIEIKSTFLRRSQRDAWLHGKTTLRRAGQQLRRKVGAIRQALDVDAELVKALGLGSPNATVKIHGWIADTSIEHDHQRFEGFLKVSVEELLIALRDDRQLLADPAGVLKGTRPTHQSAAPDADRKRWSLYPNGFGSSQLIDVIESEAVWEGCTRPSAGLRRSGAATAAY